MNADIRKALVNLINRASNILTIKSLVTLTLTGVFAALTVHGVIDDRFLTIYSVVIAFYFGTQAAKSGGEGHE